MAKESADLLNMMVQHAKTFLLEMGEFWPFGGVITKQGAITPLAAYPGGEYPEASEVIALLEKGITDKFEKEEILAAAIVSDTNFRETTTSDRTQAIKITLKMPSIASEDHYYLYRLEDGKVILYKYLIYGRKEATPLT